LTTNGARSTTTRAPRDGVHPSQVLLQVVTDGRTRGGGNHAAAGGVASITEDQVARADHWIRDDAIRSLEREEEEEQRTG
jgi:hypothetical protein